MKVIKLTNDWQKLPIGRGTIKVQGNCTALIRTEDDKPTDNNGIQIGGWEYPKTFQSNTNTWVKLLNGQGSVIVDDIVFNAIFGVRVIEPAQLTGVSASKQSINIGEKTTVTFTFDKPPFLEDIQNNDPTTDNNNITLDNEGVIAGNTVKVTYTGAKQGQTVVSMTVGQVTKSITITVAQPA